METLEPPKNAGPPRSVVQRGARCGDPIPYRALTPTQFEGDIHQVDGNHMEIMEFLWNL